MNQFVKIVAVKTVIFYVILDYVDEDTGYSYWRLRTQGQKSFFTCDIKYDGSIHDDYRAFATACGVRPVIRLNRLESVPVVNNIQPQEENNDNDIYTTNYSEFNEEVTDNSPSEEKDGTQSEGKINWWIILIAAIVILCLVTGIIVLMLKMKKSDNDNDIIYQKPLFPEYDFSIVNNPSIGKCDKCGNEDSVYPVSVTHNNKSSEMNLCKKCAVSLKHTVEQKNSGFESDDY